MTITPEQIAEAKAKHDAAVVAQTAAKKYLEDLKASSAGVLKAYEDAKAAKENLNPFINVAKAKVQIADADVTIALAAYKAIAPKEVNTNKGPSNKILLEAVKALLNGKPDGLTNQDIWDALTEKPSGDTARDNFNSYLSRWGSAGSLVNLGTGKWGYNVPVPGVPSFLAGSNDPNAGQQAPAEPAAPSFLTPTSTPLTEEFPGYAPLTEAGYTTVEQLADRLTVEDLQQIKGIGKATAEKILAARGV